MNSSRTRKGGFGDSGTLGVNGELPVALPVEVASEAALVDELSKIKASLGPKVEWSDRVHALVRLEGLVLGGAADSHGAFPHLILPLRSPLEEQLQDRRSAVSRQACHVVNVLVQACGVHFEPLAVALMPALFKAQAMAITIVTQAADECALALIRYCPCGRLLPPLCNRILQDKNGKLRLAAAAYVLQALEEWDHGVYASTRAVMERAILAAAQDATSDTRILGRAMFAAYYARHKEAAHDMLSGLPATEHALRDKLVQAVNQQLGAGTVDPVAARQKAPRRASFGGSSTAAPSPKPLQRSVSALPTPLYGAVRVPRLSLPRTSSSPFGAGPPSGFSSARVAPVASTPAPQRLASDVSRSERRRSADRLGVLATPRAMLHAAPEPDTFAKERTMGRCPGGAIRVAVQAAPQDQLEEAPATVASKRAPSSTLRVPRRASLSGELSSEHSLEKCRQVLQLPGRALEGGARQQRPTLLGFAEQEADPLVPLPEALAALSRPGLVWSTRVQLFEGIEATSAAGGEGVDRDVGAHAERLVSALLEGTGEAHFKVATAALQALMGVVSMDCAAHALAPFLERIMPALFARVADSKEQIRHLVRCVLGLLPSKYSSAAMLDGLTRALETNRPPRVKCAIMDYFTEAAASQEGQLAVLAQAGPHSASLRSLLAGFVALATDKHPDIRRSAQNAVAVAYAFGDSSAVVAAIEELPSSPKAAVSRALTHSLALLHQDDSPTKADESQADVPLEDSACSSPSVRRALQLSQDAGAATEQRYPSPDLLSPQVASLRSLSRSSSPVALPRTPGPASPAFFGRLPETGGSAGWPATSAGKSPGTVITIAVDARVSVREPPPSACSVQVAALLQQLAMGPTAQSVQGLSELVPLLRETDWYANYDEVTSNMEASLELAGPPQVMKCVLCTLADMAQSMPPELLAAWAPRLVPRLVECAASEDEEVDLAVNAALQAVLEVLDPSASLSLLIERLPSADVRPPYDGPKAGALQATLGQLQRACTRVAAPQLAAVLPMLMPQLCNCYNSASAKVRRATVECLVGAWMAVGAEAVEPYVSELTLAQRKLLEIYVERAQSTAS